MSAEAGHRQLSAVEHRHEADHSGKDPGHYPQCVHGCKWYHVLEGERGTDWGVCFNPASHRAGLLTFEHNGCAHFEIVPGWWDDPDDLPTESDPEPSPNP